MEGSIKWTTIEEAMPPDGSLCVVWDKAVDFTIATYYSQLACWKFESPFFWEDEHVRAWAILPAGEDN